MFAQYPVVVVRTLLAPPVARDVAALGRRPQGNGHPQPPDRQVALHPVADGPSGYPEGIWVQITQGDDAARIQVQYHHKILPAPAGPDAADVTHPFLVLADPR